MASSRLVLVSRPLFNGLSHVGLEGIFTCSRLGLGLHGLCHFDQDQKRLSERCNNTTVIEKNPASLLPFVSDTQSDTLPLFHSYFILIL